MGKFFELRRGKWMVENLHEFCFVWQLAVSMATQPAAALVCRLC